MRPTVPTTRKAHGPSNLSTSLVIDDDPVRVDFTGDSQRSTLALVQSLGRQRKGDRSRLAQAYLGQMYDFVRLIEVGAREEFTEDRRREIDVVEGLGEHLLDAEAM